MKIILVGNNCDLCMAYMNETSFKYVICDKEQKLLEELETKSYIMAKEIFYKYDEELTTEK